MSIYAQFDNGEQRLLSSNKGWGDISRWSESLDAEQFAEVVHLCDHGYEQQLDALEQQIQEAVQISPPPEDVVKTLSGLLDVLALRGDADVLMITDGMTSAEDERDESEESPDA